MSVTGPAQSAVDWVNPVNWGPWGPLAGALGWPQASHVGGRRRSGSGEPNAAARLGRGAGLRYGGFAGAWLGAFDAARRRASNCGGRRGWNGRGRALRARRRRGATGARRKRGYGGLTSKRRGWGASTYGGECNGLDPVTIWSPETRRRRARRRGVRARVGEQLRSAGELTERARRRRGSLRGCRGTAACSGRLEAAKRGGDRRRPKVEDELVAAGAVAPSSNGEAEVT